MFNFNSSIPKHSEKGSNGYYDSLGLWLVHKWTIRYFGAPKEERNPLQNW